MTRRHLLWGVAALSCAALVIGAWHLWPVVLLEARGSTKSDVLLYLIVGRGLLNGLIPYVDLYESKPPGMFFLSALSLKTTGGEALLAALAALLLISVPACIAFVGWKRSAGRAVAYRIALAAVAGLLGILLSLYVEEKSGMLQTELFGGMIGSLYAVSLALQRGPETRWSITFHALLLLITIGVKETFLLTTVAAALILCRDRRHFVRAFLLPLGIAAAAGIVILFLTHTLMPYLTVDLPSMGLRAGAGFNEPLWLRTFAVRRLFADLISYATSPLAGVALIFLFCARLLPPGRRAGLFDAGTAIVAGVLLLWGVHSLYAVLAYANAIFVPVKGAATVMVQWFAGLVADAGLLWLLLLRWRRGNGLSPQIPAALLALLAMALAVGMGSYTAYQYAAAAPAYAALILSVVVLAAEGSWAAAAPAAVTAAAAAVLFSPNPAHMHALREGLTYNAASMRPFIERFDEMLDACGQPRFVVFGNYERFAFSKHSPVGPLFAPQNFEFFLPPDHPLVLQTHANALALQPVVAVGTGQRVDEAAMATFGYTTTPPACAEPFLPIDGVQFFFPTPKEQP